MADIDIVIGAQDKASKVLDAVSLKVGSSTSMLASLGPVAIAAGAAIGGAAAAFFSLQAAIGAVSSSANKIDDLSDVAKGLGESVGDVQAFQFAMEEAGNISAEQSVAALKKIQRTVGDIASGGDAAGLEIFDKLGLDAQQLSMQGPVAQFTAVKKALSEIENSSERAAVAQQILGKSASDLMPALLAEQQGFEDSMRAAEELGLVISDQGAAGIASMNDAVGRLYAGFEGLSNQVAVAVAPLIEEAATYLNSWIPPMIDVAERYLPTIVDYIALAAGDAYDLGKLLLSISTLDGSGIAEALNFDTGMENLKAIQEARQRAADEAIANAEAAKASASAIAAAEREVTEEIDKQADARERERQKAIDKSQSIIEGLERQLAVMELGETAVKNMENLAAAANDEDRARIETLQNEIALRKEQEAIEKEQAKTNNQPEVKPKTVGPAAELQAIESRLLTRGRGTDGPAEATARNTAAIRELINRIRKPIEDIAESMDSPGEQLTIEYAK
jgi:hypothetical protein